MTNLNLEAGKESMEGAASLHDWLADSDWELTRLVRILSGDDVPASSARREPHEWVENCLASDGDRADVELELARRLRSLLDQKPEIIQFPPRPEKVLFNLLSVCASMHQPAELYGPLREMMRREKLRGDYDGLSLRGRLRAALASNQWNCDLEEVWVAMAQGKVGFLPGNPFNALDAILLMPMRNDIPPLNAISKGLRAVIPLLEKGDDPKLKLCRFVQRAKNSYQAGREFIGYLLYRSCAEVWPTWAREVLIPLLECEPCQHEIQDINQQIDVLLRQQANSYAQDRIKGYSVHLAATVQVWLGKIDRVAERRFADIRLPDFSDLNVGAQPVVFV